MDLIPDGARLLCLSPHPDDVEFGLGATLDMYRGRCEVLLVVFSDRLKTRGEARNDEDQRAAAKELGIDGANVKFIDELGLGESRLPVRFFGAEENRDIIRRVATHLADTFEPTTIFVPSVNENMQDHLAMAEEVVRVVRGPATILGYEVPKHNRRFEPTAFVTVSEESLAAKVRSVNRYTEFTNRYYFEEDAIKALARVRALHAGFFGYVEAFEVYRLYCGGVPPS